MMYHSCMFYTMDKEDEIIRFDEKVHKSFEFHTDIPYDEKISENIEKLGFKNDVIESLPSKRKKLWNSKRNSKVYRLEI